MKKIKFALEKNFDAMVGKIQSPSPATGFIPDWYKDGEMHINAKTGKINYNKYDLLHPGMKSCNPFLDSISSGYMITTWVDLEITKNYNGDFAFKYLEKDKNGEYIDSSIDWQMINVRQGDIGHTIPRPNGFAHTHLVWTSKWGVETPKNWSVLFTHPMNQFQLPFITLSGIIDSDRFYSHGNVPFFIQEGWTGIIPKGTPMVQIIPIKRSSWIAIAEEQTDFSEHLGIEARKMNQGYYRSKLWIPKKYK